MTDSARAWAGGHGDSPPVSAPLSQPSALPTISHRRSRANRYTPSAGLRLSGVWRRPARPLGAGPRLQDLPRSLLAPTAASRGLACRRPGDRQGPRQARPQALLPSPDRLCAVAALELSPGPAGTRVVSTRFVRAGPTSIRSRACSTSFHRHPARLRLALQGGTHALPLCSGPEVVASVAVLADPNPALSPLAQLSNVGSANDAVALGVPPRVSIHGGVPGLAPRI